MSAIDEAAATRGAAAPTYLAEWVSRQRWYASKGYIPTLRTIGSWALASAEPGVSIRTYLILDVESERAELYQVPITERSAPLDNAEHALIATVSDQTDASDVGPRYLYDAPHDRAFTRALLELILADGESLPEKEASAQAHGQAFAPDAAVVDDAPGIGATMTSSRVLGGEQSNTSIIFDLIDDNYAPTHPIICKLFRALHHGANPDVAVQLALAGAGSQFVPWPVGCVIGEWDDPALPEGRATGHLAFAQEFLPGVEDAWRVALRAASVGDDVTSRMYALGQATADVHASLAEVMPTSEATPEVIARIVDGMRQRYQLAEHEVPSLAQYSAAVEAVFAEAQTGPWPLLQRIHGDYHLGQVLNVPGRGWVLIDFEGEPLRPMNERDQPDVTLRDIAGMLRSFSYVAGALAIEDDGVAGALAIEDNAVSDSGDAMPSANAPDQQSWAFSCRGAFLDGYAARAGFDPRVNSALLDAFELDKAIYEVVYETRNRPEWIRIPLLAIQRLAKADGTPTDSPAYA